MNQQPTSPREENAPQGFFGLGIAPNLLDVLQRLQYTTPTPIQQKAIPIGIEGKDMIGIAQTGTGKTLAFSIPMLQRLAAVKGKGLILLPTRELALQVDEVLQKIGRSLGLRTVVLIGGTGMGAQMQGLKKNPHVIVATPGRLLDHVEQKSASLNDIKILVLDEADRMLDMGFAPQINKILALVPKERQTMLFSATMPTEIAKIATKYMQLPLRVEIATQGTTASRVEQEMFIIDKRNKTRLLNKLLSEYHGTVLVFSRTKHGAKKIARDVKHMGHTTAEIHSNRSLAQRKQAIEGFKSGRYRVLVATDIAARGIDVKNIELVINFDLPDAAEDYVHRIGRTGRAGQSGKAISFATPDQRGDIRQIERLVRMQLPVSPIPELPPELPPAPFTPSSSGGRPSRSGGYPPRRNSGRSFSGEGQQSGHNYPPRRPSRGGPRRQGGFKRHNANHPSTNSY